MRWIAAVLLLCASTVIGACTINVHQRDDATIAALEVTARNRADDAAVAQDTIAIAVSATASPDARSVLRARAYELRAREEAEQVRLKNVIWREQQKEP